MKHSRIRILSILAIILTLGAWAPFRRAPSTQAATVARPLDILFLPGLCSFPYTDAECSGSIHAARRADATFHLLEAELRANHIAYTAAGYSYAPSGGSTYRATDTQEAMSVAVRSLNTQIRALHTRDRTARLLLVGYSLGGVVAVDWATSYGRVSGSGPLRGVRGYVAGIVTFDSPIRGIGGSFIGSILRQLFGGQLWQDLQSNSAAIRAITGLPNVWWKTRAHLHTVANRADLIVPPAESLLGYRKTITDRQCGVDLVVLRSCHGSVLSDVPLAQWVTCHWIASCVPVATVTPTPTASPTATASPSPSPSPTVTPTTSPAPPPPPPVVPGPTATLTAPAQ